MGDVHGRPEQPPRFAITGMESPAVVTRRWFAPRCRWPSMFGYVNGSALDESQGRATYTMQFLKYAEVPSAVAENDGLKK